METVENSDWLPEEDDDDNASVDDLLRDAVAECLFCRLTDLGEGDDD